MEALLIVTMAKMGGKDQIVFCLKMSYVFIFVKLSNFLTSSLINLSETSSSLNDRKSDDEQNS